MKTLKLLVLLWFLTDASGTILGVFRTYGECIYNAPTDRAWNCVRG